MTMFMLLGLLSATSAFAQIDFDAAIGASSQNSTSQTVSYKTSGPERFLIVGVLIGGGATCTAVTYAGVTMTRVGDVEFYQNDQQNVYTFQLLNPSSGTNNIVANFSGKGPNTITAASYTGVGAVDTTNVVSSASTEAITNPMATAVAGEWLAGFAIASGFNMAGDANTTIRQAIANANIIDSNGVVFPAGTNSIGVSQSSVFGFMYIGAVALIPGIRTSWDYGDGRHGPYTLTSSMTIEQLYQLVRLPTDPAQYDPTNPQAIPNFTNFTITNNATLFASAWNGTVGGTIALKTQFMLHVMAGSTISVNGLGYQGGGAFQPGGAPTGSGGGGGGGFSAAGAQHGTSVSVPAGGGGYGSGGGGGIEVTGFGVFNGGSGGGTYGTSALSTLYLGSGGGGGTMGRGGSGGGAIALSAGRLVLEGRIDAGGSGGGTFGGGGGSGGSVLIRTNSAALGTNNLTANGGPGASKSGASGAGDGGDGRIRIEYSASYTGTSAPVVSAFYSSTNDVDGDGVPDAVEWGPNLDAPWDTDGDGIPDFLDTDSDNNGIPDAVQLGPDGLTRTQDTDGDGIPDYWEAFYGLDPNNPADAAMHPPGDKLNYLQKYQHGLNPLKIDTDGDGLSDYDEIFVYGTDPLKVDTDGDGIPDGYEVADGLNPLVNDAHADADGDGLTNLQEYQDGTNPQKWDTNNDGVSDYVRVTGSHHVAYQYDHDNRLTAAVYDSNFTLTYHYDANGNLIGQTESLVAQAPAFTLDPQNQLVFSGQRASFMASASGTPPPTYQWQIMPAGGSAWSNLSDGGIYAGTTTSTLSIGSADTTMSGDQFQCVATNGVSPNAVSTSATLTVTVPAYGDWASSLGLTGANAATGARSISPGVLPNLVRYAMNLGAAPLPSQSPTYHVSVVNGHEYLIYEYRQRKNLNGVQVVAQSSIDAINWQSNSGISIIPLTDDDPDTARYQACVLIPASGTVFLRVQAIPAL